MKAFDHAIARVPYGYEHRRPMMELDFAVDEFRRRLTGMQQAMGQRGFTALVIAGAGERSSDVRYVSGFANGWGESVVVVPDAADPVLLTNGIFHGEPMHSNVQTTWLRDVRAVPHPRSTGAPPSTLADALLEALSVVALPAASIGLVGFDHLPAQLHGLLVDRLSRYETAPASDILSRLRSIKSPAELDLLRLLGQATARGLEAGLSAAGPGVTEHELAGAMQGPCVAGGADRVTLNFVAAGPRSAMKNVWPRRGKRLVPGELVMLDCCAQLAGYWSDMARNTVVGTASPDLERLLEVSLEAQQAGLDETRPGAEVAAVVGAMSAVVERSGFGAWDWSACHGGGLDLVEAPFFVPGNRAPLEPGMTFYVEPMIIVPGVGTACVEDMVCVTDTGYENLTPCRRRAW